MQELLWIVNYLNYSVGTFKTSHSTIKPLSLHHLLYTLIQVGGCSLLPSFQYKTVQRGQFYNYFQFFLYSYQFITRYSQFHFPLLKYGDDHSTYANIPSVSRFQVPGISCQAAFSLSQWARGTLKPNWYPSVLGPFPQISQTHY